jgi:hypothetical protein
MVSVANPSTTGRAAIVGLHPLGVSVSSCETAVVLQDLGSIPTPLTVQDSNDVRLAQTDVIASSSLPAPGAAAVTAEMSRLEIVGGSMTGYTAGSPCECTLSGTAAVEVRSAARVHMALMSAIGGHGNGTNHAQAGSGGPALRVLSMGEAIVAGDGTTAFQGGWPGWATGPGEDCGHDGSPASGALVLFGGSLRESSVTFAGSCCVPYLHCTPQIYAAPISGSYTTPAPSDPTLRISGIPAAAQPIQLTVTGRPGAAAILYFGRQAIVQPDPPSAIELLTPRSRLVNLGTLPASGEKTFAWTLPTLPPGTFFCAQAEVTPASSTLQRTNSVPIVVR